MGKQSLAYKHHDFLKLLSSYTKSPKQFKQLVLNASDEEINGISELVFNILEGNLPCNKKKVKSSVKHIRYLGNKNNPIKNRKRLILKKGNGFIFSLVSVALPILLKLFSK